MLKHLIKTIVLFILLCAVSQFIGCAKPTPIKKELPILYTSILPQKDFVEKIAGDKFSVHALIGQGQNPHNYSPTPEQMAKLSKAKLFFRIGVESEEAIVPKIKEIMPDLKIIDLREGISLRTMSGEEAGVHDHGEDHGHSHGHGHAEGKAKKSEPVEMDPHIWLSPMLVKNMAITIKYALSTLDSANEATYRANLHAFTAALDTLDKELRALLNPYEGTDLFVFHPAFGYFADNYGLNQVAVEMGGKEPSAKELAAIIEEAKIHQPKVLFVNSHFSQKSAQALADQIGCAVVPINPLPLDYLKEMRALGAAIKAGLGS